MQTYLRFITFLCVTLISCLRLDINLPDEHWPYYFSNNRTAALECLNDERCPMKTHAQIKACWGYEKNCSASKVYGIPNCRGDAGGWAQSEEEQLTTFYNTADFGYIKIQKHEIKTLCESNEKEGSFLACSDYTRFCYGKNLLIDFKRLNHLAEPIKYKDNILGPGLIGGYCKLDSTLLKSMGEHKSPLQSWYAELEHFTELDSNPIDSNRCDVIVDRPTVIMKLDASINMYHHFCDFINLYNSFHVNGSFSRDINIVLWDTVDYYGNFGITWEAFTKHPLMSLKNWKGKKVCFKDFVLPLLPRMIYGMYYNMPLVPGCENSGLFHAFNRYILHNLNIISNKVDPAKIRITFLSRNTAYRNVLNENEIISALKKVPNYIVKRIVFDHRNPFEKQLQITQNTDIFIGMHGAGLTHLLFLPDWAVVFELYNCDDEFCYKDLARLRGVKYLTWENTEKMKPFDEGHHPKIGAHAKFTDYTFDIQEVLRIVAVGAKHVSEHEMFFRASQKSNHPIRDEL